MSRRPMAAVGPRLVLGLGVAGLALVGSTLAACAKTTGTGGLGAVPAVTAPVGTASSPSAPATAAPSDTPTSTPTTTPVSATPCTVKQVKVSVVDPDDGAAGTIVQRFVLTNASTQKCWMNKTPFVAPYGPLKQGSTTVEATLEVPVGPIPSNFGQLGAAGGKQTLSPGGKAVFFLKWSQVPTGNETSCPQADGFDFRPPNDPSTDNQALVPYAFTPCDLQVSQVLPSSVGP